MFESRRTLKKLLEASERRVGELEHNERFGATEHKMAIKEIEQNVKMLKEKLEFEYKTKELEMKRANAVWIHEQRCDLQEENIKIIEKSHDQTKDILDKVITRLPDISASLTVGKGKK